VPEDRRRCKFLVVGCWDNTVRVMSLDPDNYMTQLSMQAVPVPPHSAALVEHNALMYLNIGLQNGVLLRTSVDPSSGTLSDTRSRFLGARPVKLKNVNLNGEQCMVALTDKPHVVYNHINKWILAPFSYESLETVSSFNAEICPLGMVATHDNFLRVLHVPKLGDAFHQVSIPLTLTPKKLAVHPAANMIAVICADHNAYTSAETKVIVTEAILEGTLEPASESNDLSLFKAVPPEAGKWASSLSLIDPATNEIAECIEFDNNEAAVSLCVVQFKDRGGESFLVVGTVRDLRLHESRNGGGFIYVYRLIEGRSLLLMHKTPVEDVPYALCAFKGRLLVGSGKSLKLFDLGKLKLLRKCQNNSFPYFIHSIHAMGDRIYVGDGAESFVFCKYNRTTNSFSLYADDVLPRFLTATALLDYDTIVGGDKFGSIFVSRLPATVSDDSGISGDSKSLWDSGSMNGAPNKLDSVLNYFLGDVVTSVKKATLNPRGGVSSIIFSTISGSIGALTPFAVREDVDFFSHLEMYMRNESLSVVGRDNLAYRSFYAPTKGVIDGDLCELFSTLPYEKQKEIAGELERPVSEVLKKIEDARSKVL
jgi:splicing factor 3B subunit 3